MKNYNLRNRMNWVSNAFRKAVTENGLGNVFRQYAPIVLATYNCTRVRKDEQLNLDLRIDEYFNVFIFSLKTQKPFTNTSDIPNEIREQIKSLIELYRSTDYCLRKIHEHIENLTATAESS